MPWNLLNHAGIRFAFLNVGNLGFREGRVFPCLPHDCVDDCSSRSLAVTDTEGTNRVTPFHLSSDWTGSVNYFASKIVVPH